jgi:hypothetical protein
MQARIRQTCLVALVAAALVVMNAGTTLAQRGSAAATVVGVWRVSEVTYTGPAARTVTNPQPAIRIFTKRHYSVSSVNSDQPRPDVPATGATDKQIAEAYTAFSGQSGTYEIKGNELTTRPIAAKAPSQMRAGVFTTYTIRLEGDTLWLVSKANQDGPVANPTTTRLTRVE